MHIPAVIAQSKFSRGATLAIAMSTVAISAIVSPQAQASTDVPAQIKWTIPFGVGGGTDVWARFFAPWFSNSLPDNPTVVIDNVPGGGSINGANIFSIRASHKGDNWIGTSASTQYPAMLGDPRVRYDYADWTPILATPTGGVVYAQPRLGESADEVMASILTSPVKLAAQSPTGVELPVLLALDLLGVDVDAVFGMRSRGEGRLAFERGEADIDFQTTSAYLSSVQPLVDDGKAIPLFSLGILDDQGDIVRDPAFPELPTFLEVYASLNDNQMPTGEAYTAYRKFFASGYTLQKLVMVPKDAPQKLIDTYREAAREFVASDAFKQESQAQLGPYEPVIGEVVQRHLDESMDLKDSTREWLANWLKTEHDASI
uniref:tricarboxylate transporter n=1 Tax=Halomonas sp. TaxID=1486246 RepID=UPI00262A99C2|nr:tricarboxylate transporter [Halomonas sp.]